MFRVSYDGFGNACRHRRRQPGFRSARAAGIETVDEFAMCAIAQRRGGSPKGETHNEPVSSYPVRSIACLRASSFDTRLRSTDTVPGSAWVLVPLTFLRFDGFGRFTPGAVGNDSAGL